MAWKFGKIQRKILEIEEMIWNNFCYWHFFQISMDFELFKIFRVKIELTEICSNRLSATTIANPPELKFGQEVLHGGLQTLQYDLVAMHKRTPKIKEARDFQR
jgi:hypothetical protein